MCQDEIPMFGFGFLQSLWDLTAYKNSTASEAPVKCQNTISSFDHAVCRLFGILYTEGLYPVRVVQRKMTATWQEFPLLKKIPSYILRIKLEIDENYLLLNVSPDWLIFVKQTRMGW